MKMKPYQVKEGDNLWKIARDHGFQSEQDLLAVQENKDFFESTSRNPHRIYPGDTIYIPPTTPHESSIKTNQKVVFRTPSRKGFVRLKVNDVEGNPVSKFKYEAEVYGQTFSGDETSHGGDIEIELPQKIEDGRVLPLGELTKAERDAISSNDDHISAQTLDLKLFVNADEPNQFEHFRVNFNFNPNDQETGLLHKMSNECEYSGFIPEVLYETALSRVKPSRCTPDGWLNSVVEEQQNSGQNRLPAPTTANLNPDYYELVWESLRYFRLYALSKETVESLEQKLEELKSSGEPMDVVSNGLTLAERDVSYFRYCFNYWLSELSNTWNGLSASGPTSDILFRSRAHYRHSDQFKSISDQWMTRLEAESEKQKILGLPYPKDEVDHIQPEKDVFTTFYSVEQKKNKLYTTIVVPPLATKVRFSYQDASDTPIANSYVIYWRYDKKDPNRIETGRDVFYKNARIMMPIGIGKTDSQGYLRQSFPLSHSEAKAYIKRDDEHFSLNVINENEEGLSHDFMQPLMAKFESAADEQKFYNDIQPINESWVEKFNEVNKGPTREHWSYRHNYSELRQLDTHDEYVNEILQYADGFFTGDHYDSMRKLVANHKFNYYSSGSSDIWGFMVYAPDTGLIRTANLADLGNEGEFAYKGPLNPPKDQDKFIKLPCTLQEWERRLKIEVNGMKDAVESYEEATKNHVANVGALNRMEGLINLYEKYPYEEQDEGSTPEQRKDLRTKVTRLSEAIKGLTINPDPIKDKPIADSIERIQEYADKIIELLNNQDFAKQLQLYIDYHESSDEQFDSPYMEYDQSWMSIYTTVADAIYLLAESSSADDAYESVIKPVMDSLVTSDVVTNILKDGNSDLSTIADEYKNDTIVVDRIGNTIEEHIDDLVEFVNKKYSNVDRAPEDDGVLGAIFKSDFYKGAKGTQKHINQWISYNEGKPSVLMAVLEGYMTYILKDATQNGVVNGYHIRLLMLVSQGFGLFGEGGASKSGLLAVLKTNEDLRLGAKIEIKKGIKLQVDEALALVQADIDRTNTQISKVETLLDKSKKSRINQLKARLRRLESIRTQHEATLADRQEEIEHLMEYRRKKQIGLVEDYDFNRRTINRKNVKEFYEGANGRVAKAYKNIFTIFTNVAVIEDWRKLSRDAENLEQGKIDLDIVMAKTISTVCATAEASAGTILMLNRWAGSESKIFGNTSWLKNMATGIESIAKKAAIGLSLLSLYVSVRELAESYNNLLMIEKVEQFLGVAADSMFVLGSIAAAGIGLSIGGLSAISGFALCFVLAGVALVVAIVAWKLYNAYTEYEFKKEGPVGYYFWEEFNTLKANSQRYYDSECYVSDSEEVVLAYSDLFAVQDGKELQVFSEHEGWGHLSWRAAVPLYRQWKQARVPNNKINAAIKNLCRTPSTVLNEERIDRGVSSTTNSFLLVSAMGMLRFYKHLASSIAKHPEKRFEAEDESITYRSVMNKLEQGLYIPGPEMAIIEEIVKLDESDFVEKTKSGQASRHQVINHHTIWDHDFFKQLPNEV